MSQNRQIMHVDMDAFFASVEQRDRPELRGKPVAVGGGSERGVVAAASYEARKFGVFSAMSSRKAKQNCPELIFVRPRFEVYKEVSYQIRDIFAEYSDLIEPLSLDEAYLDISERSHTWEEAWEIGQSIKSRIKEETQLTASAGISINKFLAKIASDFRKPNGLMLIRPEEADGFLKKLAIHKFHGIGKVTAAKMKALGIHSGADLMKWSKPDLVRKFGKMGGFFYHIARAEDFRPVNPHRIRKSVGAERTFSEDLVELPELQIALRNIAGILWERMKKGGFYGRTLTLKIKYHNFKQITRAKTIHRLLDDEDILRKMAEELLVEHWGDQKRVRLLGLQVSNRESEKTKSPKGVQLTLNFDGE